MGITEENRIEAYVVRPATRAVEILKVLGDREMTSREIAGNGLYRHECGQAEAYRAKGNRFSRTGR